MPRSPARKALLAALWLFYVAALQELAGFAYFVFIAPNRIGAYGYPDGLFVVLDRVGYGMTPNFAGHFPGDLYRGIPIRINSSGFRDAEFPPNDHAKSRVAVLGDSVVFGAGIRAEERFSDVLRGTAPGGGRPLEPLNLGVSSYSLPNYVALARRILPEVRPDWVILAFTLNDYEGLKQSWAVGLVAVAEPPFWTLSPGRMLEYAIRNSHGRRMLIELRDTAELAVRQWLFKEPYHTQWMRMVISEWGTPDAKERVQSGLVELQDVLAGMNLHAMYLLLPELDDVLHPGQFERPRRTALALLTATGEPVCDPYQQFAHAENPTGLFLPGDSVHFTPAGNRLLADALADCIRSGSIGR